MRIRDATACRITRIPRSGGASGGGGIRGPLISPARSPTTFERTLMDAHRSMVVDSRCICTMIRRGRVFMHFRLALASLAPPADPPPFANENGAFTPIVWRCVRSLSTSVRVHLMYRPMQPYFLLLRIKRPRASNCRRKRGPFAFRLACSVQSLISDGYEVITLRRALRSSREGSLWKLKMTSLHFSRNFSRKNYCS